ncbi:MAG: PTS sugar transporter subunit IIA [bacterium]|nr:PTS sugar transporter subunit IIA [bacterium]
MTIFEFLKEDNMTFEFDAADKKSFFLYSVAVIVEKNPDYKHKDVLKLFRQREKTMTTGVGKRIAIPHIIYDKCPAQQLFLFSLSNPIDFKSLDDQSVELIIMFVGPKRDSNLPYLQLLAKLSRLMKKDAVVEKLLAAKSSEAVCKVLREHERR